MIQKSVNSDGLAFEIKTKIIALCKAIIPDASIFLYGSRARGDYRDTSDIDLALCASRPLTYVEIDELKDVLKAANISHSFDIIDINAIKDVKVKHNIEKDMILWKK